MDSLVEYNFPGQVDVRQLKLLSIRGVSVDLNDYLVELNIYEDIFSNFIHGQIMLSDSNSLVSRLPIIGDEILIISYGTPTLNRYFEKHFHVYSITDQKIVNDTNTQTYILHFCSAEATLDANLAVFDPYSGDVATVAQTIFEKYLKHPRYVRFEEKNIGLNEEQFTRFNFSETQNKIKFISPGWSPAKCINWLCSKAIPKKGKACDYLFWESTAGFFFASIEDLIDMAFDKEGIAGSYFYVPPGNLTPADKIPKMFLAESFEVVNYSDNLLNFGNGFYASKLISYDPISKRYSVKDYDYPSEYSSFKHTEGDISAPPFSVQVIRNPVSYSKVYPINPYLFSNITNNYTESMPDIFGNRTSKLNELNNFKINITVHGRSDMYAGCLIRFNFPQTGSHDDSNEIGTDKLYTGNYLVSAIRHKINPRNHMMIMELVKTAIPNIK